MGHDGMQIFPGEKVESYDYKGNIADRSKTGGWIPAMFIVGVELCERLTTLCVTVNLGTYLINIMHVPSAQSANIITNFVGTSFLLCLLGGFLADTYLGRYLTIAVFASVQSLGVAVLTVSTTLPELNPPPCTDQRHESCKRANGMQMGVLYMALYLIALGNGGLKSSVSGFGADQFDERDEKERKHMDYFFNRFFFCISIGSLLAVTVLVYVQDKVGRNWGYGICASCMFMAIVLFLGATKKYRFKKRDAAGSPLTQIAQVLVAAWKKRKLQLPPSLELLYEQDSSNRIVHTPNFRDRQPSLLRLVSTARQCQSGATAQVGENSKRKTNAGLELLYEQDSSNRIVHTPNFRCLDKAAIVETSSSSSSRSMSRWRLCSVSKVEEVKSLARMMPIWATTIMFWTVYAQMVTFSVQQATNMDTRIGTFKVPPASLTGLLMASILATAVVYEKIVMPLLERRTSQKQSQTEKENNATAAEGGGGPTPLQRIGAGLILSLLGIGAAAAVEAQRRKSAKPMSALALAPQFVVVGAGEALVYAGQLDFFIREAPRGMRALSTGLFMSSIALGFFCSTCLVSLVNAATHPPWLPTVSGNNLNSAHLHYYYCTIALLSAANFVAFLLCARRYIYRYRYGHSSGYASPPSNTNTTALVQLPGAPAAPGQPRHCPCPCPEVQLTVST